jgi:hypothetical protein
MSDAPDRLALTRDEIGELTARRPSDTEAPDVVHYLKATIDRELATDYKVALAAIGSRAAIALINVGEHGGSVEEANQLIKALADIGRLSQGEILRAVKS